MLWLGGTVGLLIGLFICWLMGRLRRVPRLPVRRQSELEGAITHIAYEYVGLERALEAFQRTALDGGGRRFDLEAALVHARNLVDFFWVPSTRHRPHRDGVYAAHYVPLTTNWVAARSSMPQRPNERYPAMCAQLAHISVTRADDGQVRDFEAALGGIAADLDEVWRRWRELLSAAWVAALDEEVTRWRAAP
jgi:hypothetical protein